VKLPRRAFTPGRPSQCYVPWNASVQKARTSEEEREAKAMGDRNKWMSGRKHSAGRGVGTEITDFKAGVLLKKHTTFDGKSNLITES